MNKFAANKFYKIGSLLANLIEVIGSGNVPAAMFTDFTRRDNIYVSLRIIANECRTIDLIQSAKAIDRLIKELGMGNS